MVTRIGTTDMYITIEETKRIANKTMENVRRTFELVYIVNKNANLIVDILEKRDKN